ncbi:hypothetical protein [Pueribacillus theae]|uniref:hypothetical protein n=1 Tax=Pueribacillus theae TaxID=2171751 RepID=UPI001F0C088A|nr:hypothetical protein [Pueribacillus theae]
MELGQVVLTKNAADKLKQEEVRDVLNRYINKDWGELDKEDWEANDHALENNGRILASYSLDENRKVWIITEWDRSATTILLPEDY